MHASLPALPCACTPIPHTAVSHVCSAHGVMKATACKCHASHCSMYCSTRSKNCPNASVHSCCSLAYRLRHLVYSPPAGTRSRKTNRPYGKRLPAELEVSTQCLRSIQRQVPGVPLVPGHGAASCARCHLVFWWTEPPRMRPPVELPSVFESIATSTVLRPFAALHAWSQSCLQ